MFEVVKVRSITLAAAAVAVSGCAIIGGSKMIAVRGELPVSAGECFLDFVVADTGRVKMTQVVTGDFGARIVLSGGVAQRYYFVARCPRGRTYRSEGMTISMSDDVIQVVFFRTKCKQTSLAEEQRLSAQVMNAPTSGFLGCAVSVSNVIFQSGYFPFVDPDTFWPSDLREAAGK